MPDRIIREGIISSDAVNTLSWGAEVFYRRLLNKVDDFARYDGRASILRAQLYPLQLDKVTEPDIAKWIAESREAGLVRVYEVEKKPYLEVENFRQRIRAKVSKWPPPDRHARADVSGCQSRAAESEYEYGVEYESESGKARAPDSQGEMPTIAEIEEFGKGPPGIDPAYCRHYHAKKTESHGWIKNGKLIVWRSEIVRWWASDRDGWLRKKTGKGIPQVPKLYASGTGNL